MSFSKKQCHTQYRLVGTRQNQDVTDYPNNAERNWHCRPRKQDGRERERWFCPLLPFFPLLAPLEKSTTRMGATVRTASMRQTQRLGEEEGKDKSTRSPPFSDVHSLFKSAFMPKARQSLLFGNLGTQQFVNKIDLSEWGRSRSTTYNEAIVAPCRITMTMPAATGSLVGHLGILFKNK